MATENLTATIDALFQEGRWEDARTILIRELDRDPESHWLLTQLGVSYYEQGRHEEALKALLASLRFQPKCPLTLWNLAGTLDAMGEPARAVEIYTWLLRSNRTAEQDPCWESKEWTDGLKTDCLYRMAICFRELGKTRDAELWFRQYVNLLLEGFEGTYSIEDVGKQLKKLQPARKKLAARGELQRIVRSALQQSGIEQVKGGRNAVPRFSEQQFFPGRRVASKK